MFISYLLLLLLSHFVVGIMCAFYFLMMIHLENKKYQSNEPIWSNENRMVFGRIVLQGYVSLIIILVVHSTIDNNESDYD